MDIKRNFGNKIRELRRIHNMSQEDLCYALNIKSSSLSAIETGKSFPAPKNLTKICEIFNLLPKELFDFQVTTLDSDCADIIHEINTVLPELDNEKLLYLLKTARMYADKN